MSKVTKQKIDKRIPRYTILPPTFKALKALGGSGTNEEILNQIIRDLNISEYGIGVRPVTTYEVDEEFFRKI